ncbi:glycosyltransferase family 4 protein [Desulfotomaculum copahuensis]|uniref:Glycosyltransferase subfamily 4-like N-terminal domain-containing protein n=1 Tax=Desulfotomaculum copahuensis TaxID=1838280 RepID=A0A1B7LI64_9FIRM|nr:glycosyltransferase family 4 protein [Desulfotomaculum copahuensis]OAT86071.1 hypothetical protein A6M21_16995 [Desulfotomaculum copahuensis]
MIKLLQLITLSELGGAQMVLYHLVSGLERGKYDITVACAPGGDLVARLRALDGVRVVEIPALKREIAPVSDLTAFLTLYRLMRRERFGIVHCHSSKAGILGRLAARAAGVPGIIFTVHGWGINDYQSRGKRLLFTAAERLAGRLSSRVVCVSRADLEKGRREKLAPPEKLALIYNGVPAPGAGGKPESADLLAPRKDSDVDSGTCRTGMDGCFDGTAGEVDRHTQHLAISSGMADGSVTNGPARAFRVPAVEKAGIEHCCLPGKGGQQAVDTMVRRDVTGTCRFGGNNTCLRRELGLHDGHLLVGMVCRLRAPKEPLFFLAAVRALLNGAPDGRPSIGAGRAAAAAVPLEGGEPWACRLRFVLIGDGPLRPACEEYIKKHGLEGRVFLTGTRADAAALMAGLDVFVLFSRWEGLPLTVIEAMQAGRPVVASAVGGVPELVQPGVTGYLVPSGDLPAAVERLSALLADGALRRNMGEAGRRLAAERFSVARMVGEYDALYRAVLEKRNELAQ